MAWEKLGTASVSGTPANTSWKELGRTTLGSNGDSIDVTSLATKDNLMVLCHTFNTGGAAGAMANQFNGDTGANYSERRSTNGGSDGTTTGATGYNATSGEWNSSTFHVSNIINIAAQEKLIITSSAMVETAGASNEPRRQEAVAKWANTSAQINRINIKNSGAGDFASGSECIVLGFDNDEADSGTNFWQELASVTRTDSGSTLESGNFAAKKYLMVEACTIPANNGFKGRLEVGHSNGTMDTGSNYADRYEADGGSDSTNASGTYTYAYTNHDDKIQHLKMFIVNKSDKEKLMMWWASSGGSATGAGNAPQRRNGVAKWANTSNQITNIRLNNQVAGGDAASGSFIKVYGAD